MLAFAALATASVHPAPVVSESIKLNTGASMPAHAFGTYRLEGDEMKKAVVCAIEAGYRHFDTSAGYENEGIVGDAIIESGVPREDFFITTKLWCTDHGGEETVGAILGSLSELSTEYIDLYLIHAPNNLGENAEEIVNKRRESWSVMEEFHQMGSLRAIGVSNFEARHMEDLRECGFSVTPAVNQVELHAYLGQKPLRDYCADRGILVGAYGSLGAAGLLEEPSVQALAAAKSRTPAQVSLRHGLQRGAYVLSRSVTPERIKENSKLFDFELTNDEVALLDALDCDERTYWDNSDVP